ncbi:MAG: DNA repair protein radA [Microgenomates bacterium 39_7]|nr:MAG: DNA repair protein radA [Microgenomates bacterium 39_7]
MAKAKTVYVCQSCGTSLPKWQGRCTQCGAWNSLVEEVVEERSSTKTKAKALKKINLGELLVSRPEVGVISDSKQRFSSGVGELDRVLGGGVVPGAVMLIGGEPGIGKSTLLTQVSLVMSGLMGANIFNDEEPSSGRKAKKSKKRLDKVKSESKGGRASKAQEESGESIDQQKILYVCGEESPEQINLRINRILNNEHFLSKYEFEKDSGNLIQAVDQILQFAVTTDVDQLVAVMESTRPNLVIVDSIQTLATLDLTGASGSIGQVRESTERIISISKRLSIPVFLVGHVTKEGAIAGPKVLEHMVDSVLQLEGERTGQFRLLRALKNRFGATDEVGVFKVVEYGYEEVSNPSEIFLEHQQERVAGSAVACVMEGTRPLLIEAQSLVNQSQLVMPRRVGRGIELSRIQVLAAVLQKHCRLPLASHDIFLSAAGGFRISEPAVDLALAVAIASSLNNRPIKAKTVFIGEVGLLGEVRQVASLERRIKEAHRLGYKNVISAKTHRTLKEVLADIGLLG